MVTIITDSDLQFNTKNLLTQLKLVVKELGIKGDLTIKLGGEAESQSLNAQYRGKNYPTDVLSFFCGEDHPDGYYLGDIFICYPVAVEQASEYSIGVDKELFTLMIHGILHLSGYDHQKDDGSMLAKQQQLIEKFWEDA